MELGGEGSRKPGVLKPQQGVKGCCPLRTFVGSKVKARSQVGNIRVKDIKAS